MVRVTARRTPDRLYGISASAASHVDAIKPVPAANFGMSSWRISLAIRVDEDCLSLISGQEMPSRRESGALGSWNEWTRLLPTISDFRDVLILQPIDYWSAVLLLKPSHLLTSALLLARFDLNTLLTSRKLRGIGESAWGQVTKRTCLIWAEYILMRAKVTE